MAFLLYSNPPCSEYFIIMKYHSYYSGMPIISALQPLSSNYRFHATGHKDGEMIQIWPIIINSLEI